MNRSRSFIALAVLLLSALVPHGCNDRGDARDIQTLRVGLVSLPPGLGNPFSSTGVPTIYTWAAMFDALTFTTAEGEVLPWLATSWEPIDPLTWRFRLREDVTFHNGEPFTAQSVVKVVDYITSTAARRESVRREVASIKAARTDGAHDVIITTHAPTRALPNLMAMLPIVEPNAWAALGRDGFAREPVGTGPFKFERWRDGGASLKAYAKAWNPPQVERLELLALPDATSRIQALQSGEIDIAVSISPDYQSLIEASGGTVDAGLTGSVLVVAFILTKLPDDHPLHNKQVRQALNYAVNKTDYIKALFDDVTVPASQPIAARIPGYNDALKPYPYDPVRAKKMLADAGYGDGFTLTFDVMIGGGAGDEAVYQNVARDLEAVGVRVRMNQITVPRFIQNIQAGTWEGEIFPMNYNPGRTMDALRFARLHSCMLSNPWVCDEVLTQKIKDAGAIWEAEARARAIEEIMATYHHNAPAIWLHRIFYLQGLSGRVQNFEQHIGHIRYDKIRLEPAS